MKVLLVALLIVACSASVPLLWPLPRNATFNVSASALKVSPCNVNYIIESPIQPNIKYMVDWYLDQVFKCPSKIPSNISINIVVPARTVNLPLETSQDSYSLVIRSSGRWELFSNEYTGFLRAFETFSQLF